jgi:putative ABC transport system permease protein
MAVSPHLWLVWSWRDLRRRWLMVAAIALIIAVGTGVYAGVGGTTPWRLKSNDASYALLGFHDLKATLPDGGFASTDSLRAAAREIPHADWIAAAEERLVVPIQLDASVDDKVILVAGRLIGAVPDATVNRLFLTSGVAPASATSAMTVTLESKFADVHGLTQTGTVRISGGTEVRYASLGYTPEYFRVVGRPGTLATEAGFGVLFATLADAQTLTDHNGQVNDLVLRLVPGADADLVAGEVRDALAAVGATVETRDDDLVYHGLYEDARNDQQTWDFFAILILIGAGFAAFNLISRLVEAERHQIGVGMALGVPSRSLAIRPLLVGVEVAALGAVLGVGTGLAAGAGMRAVLEDSLPMPVWLTPFPLGRYVRAAALGLLVPIVATLIPVMRAIRVEPVDALRSMPGAGRASGRLGAGLAPLARHLPGRVVTSLPLRNLLRASRRTTFTALGIAAAITTVVAVIGMFDSVFDSIDRIDTELTAMSPDRLQVSLEQYTPVSLIEQAPVAADLVSDADVGLRIGSRLIANDTEIDAFVELLDMDAAMWRPAVSSGRLPDAGEGIVLAKKAASDLGVSVGDAIVLHHPVRDGTSFVLVDTELPVSGIHDNPLRFLAYLDAGDAHLFNMDGLANLINVRPAAGVSQDDVKRALFSQPGVATVDTVGGIGPEYRERFAAVSGVLRILETAAFALALLIAFNSASIAMEERQREQATMFAFGLPPRTVMRLLVTESLLVGILGTLVGIGSGYRAMTWIIHQFTTSTVPDLGLTARLSLSTIVPTIVLGVLVVAAAPLLTLRRLTRLDIASRLRVLE